MFMINTFKHNGISFVDRWMMKVIGFRCWIDKFHALTHTRDICSYYSETIQGLLSGILNIKHPRFERVRLGIRNTNIVEQFWIATNQCRYAKRFHFHKFRWWMLKYTIEHNKETYKDLQRQGFEFKDITNVPETDNSMLNKLTLKNISKFKL